MLTNVAWEFSPFAFPASAAAPKEHFEDAHICLQQNQEEVMLTHVVPKRYDIEGFRHLHSDRRGSYRN